MPTTAAPPASPTSARILAAETIGTAIVVIGVLGVGVLAEGIGPLGVAVGAGLSVIAAIVVVGHVSGAHVNPAVSLAMAVAGKIRASSLVFYWIGQILGAALGSLAVWGVASGVKGFEAKNHFFQNGWGSFSPGGYGLGAVIAVELVFSVLWVVAVLSTEHRDVAPGTSVLAVGLTVTLAHLVTLTVDNTGINPARSFAAALFAGSDAWGQLWVFILAPLVAAVIGVFVWLAVDEATLESTPMFNPALAQARDIADRVVDEAVEGIESLERGD